MLVIIQFNNIINDKMPQERRAAAIIVIGFQKKKR